MRKYELGTAFAITTRILDSLDTDSNIIPPVLCTGGNISIYSLPAYDRRAQRKKIIPPVSGAPLPPPPLHPYDSEIYADDEDFLSKYRRGFAFSWAAAGFCEKKTHPRAMPLLPA